MQAESLNQQHAITNRIIFRQYHHSVVAEITSDYATARVSLYGAQVLSFIPNGHNDLLFVSQNSFYQAGKAIRGGIPVCWPWFGGHPSEKDKPSHGFARLSQWTVLHSQTENGNVRLQLGLSDTKETRSFWPFSFEATMTITVGKTLQVALMTRNAGTQAFSLTGALHTYFRVSDSEQISIEGLNNTRYMDDVTRRESIQKDGLLTLKGEVDRCYLETTRTCIIDDPEYKRKIKVEKAGSTTTVVWNPGAELATKMQDLGDWEYASMVCVEAANAMDDLIYLNPGQSHELSTRISVL